MDIRIDLSSSGPIQCLFLNSHLSLLACQRTPSSGCGEAGGNAQELKRSSSPHRALGPASCPLERGGGRTHLVHTASAVTGWVS